MTATYTLDFTVTATYTFDQAGTYEVSVPRFSANRFELRLMGSGLSYRRVGREFAITVQSHQVPVVITHTY